MGGATHQRTTRYQGAVFDLTVHLDQVAEGYKGDG
jgi:hypothetical protein